MRHLKQNPYNGLLLYCLSTADFLPASRFIFHGILNFYAHKVSIKKDEISTICINTSY